VEGGSHIDRPPRSHLPSYTPQLPLFERCDNEVARMLTWWHAGPHKGLTTAMEKPGLPANSLQHSVSTLSKHLNKYIVVYTYLLKDSFLSIKCHQTRASSRPSHSFRFDEFQWLAISMAGSQDRFAAASKILPAWYVRPDLCVSPSVPAHCISWSRSRLVQSYLHLVTITSCRTFTSLF